MKTGYFALLFIGFGIFLTSCTTTKTEFGGFDPVKRDYSYRHNLKMVKFASLAYLEEAEVKSTLEKDAKENWNVTFLDDSETDAQAYFFANDIEIVIAFRGTASSSDALADLKFWKESTPYGNIHAGFASQYKNLMPLLNDLIKPYKTKHHRIWVTGHSLGGALAAIFAVQVPANFQAKIGGIYTYGQPEVGDQEFTEQLDARFPDAYFRMTSERDKVSDIVPGTNNHAGIEIFYNAEGQPFCGGPKLGFWGTTKDVLSTAVRIVKGDSGHFLSVYEKLLNEPKNIKAQENPLKVQSRCRFIVEKELA
ncbi:MAG: lipase family protein [SAR324 cluster bacterium]|nr:lipase family protein [SAR324 cluster bacterium]